MSTSIGASSAAFGFKPMMASLVDADATLDHEQQWDSVETYFECISTCSLDDGECITECVEKLREHH